jgi:hypothetical protein
MLRHSDRMRYYNENITWDDFDFLHREVRRIMKEYS